eukprot:223264-Chlamydomonas_euryale.AAC.1
MQLHVQHQIISLNVAGTLARLSMAESAIIDIIGADRLVAVAALQHASAIVFVLDVIANHGRELAV